MTPKTADPKIISTTAPRLNLTRQRLHFTSYPMAGIRQGPRLHLTFALVGRR